jgi:ketosteroid isomerase-like protein
MQYLRCLAAIAATVIISTLQTAQADESADLDAVRQANATLLEVAGSHDIDALADLWRQDDYVRAIHPFRPIDKGWDEVRDGFLALYELFPEFSSVMPEPDIRVVGDVAWVSGLEEFKGVMASGDVIEVTLRTGRIFEREGDKWLVVYHQVSPPPEEE